MFESEQEPERCPDCGKTKVRLANALEITEYEKRKKEFYRLDESFLQVDLQEKLSVALQEVNSGKVKSHEEVFDKYNR